MATLADIPDVTVPTLIGYQMPLDGGSGNAQTYTVQSSNPNLKATIAQGQFLTFNVTHASSGANDPAFTGKFTFQLFGDLTPDTVEHISRLVSQGFYDGKLFPRVANGFPTATDFILQGGSTTTSDTVNQPGFPFADEFVQQLAFTGKGLKATDTTSIYAIAGQLAMANSGSDTNGSQFFITTADPRSLDFKHTIFGQLVSSDVQSGKIIPILMTQVARTGDTPVSPITITSATLAPTSPDGVVHIDATAASPGETATLTVTATDSVDHTTTTKSFKVDVAANPVQERVFINGRIQNQVVGLTDTTAPIQGQVDEFAIPYVNPNGPTGNVAFIVRGGVTSSGFTNVANATATVDANGIVKVTPNAGFSGVINLVVGVRNASAPDNVSSYDTQTLTLTVNQSAAINLPPVAVQGTTTTVTGTPTPVQLVADTGNPDSQQTLVYEIIGPPTHGSITGFDNTKGTFTYVPDAGFQGNEAIQFRVRDVGDPTPNLSSATATETIVVDGGDTGAVRLIGKVLVVTPLPRTDSVPNTINVNLFNNRVQVTVNGRLDSIQPLASDLNRVVVYGATTGDIIKVAPSVTVPTTLDGGHGGVNNITSGGGPTTTHVWFGKNTVNAGPGRDYIVGHAGRFRVLNPADKDTAFAGLPRRMASLHALALKPRWAFFKTRNGRLVPVPTPHPVTAAKRAEIFTPPATATTPTTPPTSE